MQRTPYAYRYAIGAIAPETRRVGGCWWWVGRWIGKWVGGGASKSKTKGVLFLAKAKNVDQRAAEFEVFYEAWIVTTH